MSFVSGGVFALAALVLLLPWLRTIPRLATLPALPWPAGVAALAAIAIVLALNHEGPAAPSPQGPATASASAPTISSAPGNAWSDVANAMDRGIAAPAAAGGTKDPGRAGSMDAAIAALQARLAQSGGSNDDWELLAKSYEFLGRPQQAAQARAHQLPAPGDSSAPAASAAAAVSGEVTLAPALAARAPAGTTLFIVAKSVDSPGTPVAVYRGSVGAWPLKFSLDDSQSMLPGRTLSSAGRVTIEARISRSGQPLASSGDLQGTSAVITARDRTPVKIVIDKVLP